MRFSGTSFATGASPSPQSSATLGPGLQAVGPAGPSTIIATGIDADGAFGEGTNQD
jgi:hypothetical protein